MYTTLEAVVPLPKDLLRMRKRKREQTCGKEVDADM
jgi:hypothetical protein